MDVSDWLKEQNAVPRPRCSLCRHPRAEEMDAAAREFVRLRGESERRVSANRFFEKYLVPHLGLECTIATWVKHARRCLELEI